MGWGCVLVRDREDPRANMACRTASWNLASHCGPWELGIATFPLMMWDWEARGRIFGERLPTAARFLNDVITGLTIFSCLGATSVCSFAPAVDVDWVV